MSNLGVGGIVSCRDRAPDAPLIKKCAILSMVDALDQLYTGKYDECCAMLRAFAATENLQSNNNL
ncbi:hypothetical protein EPZ47_06230 [Pseudomonas viciae]|uniref:Uncharacterized protein n=1 Tax=Pseudomonas viciae TaxID=2505979 RepID=A0A4P7PCT2_9PSED|nr:hypothetical protein EPZ47_06230 [Pseudomonas viciae]